MHADLQGESPVEKIAGQGQAIHPRREVTPRQCGATFRFLPGSDSAGGRPRGGKLFGDVLMLHPGEGQENAKRRQGDSPCRPRFRDWLAHAPPPDTVVEPTSPSGSAADRSARPPGAIEAPRHEGPRKPEAEIPQRETDRRAPRRCPAGDAVTPQLHAGQPTIRFRRRSTDLERSTRAPHASQQSEVSPEVSRS